MPTPESPQREFVIHNAPSLGAGVRHFRRSRGLTQAQLAQRIRISQSDLSLLEGGRTTKQVETLIRALSALGVKLVLQETDGSQA